MAESAWFHVHGTQITAEETAALAVVLAMIATRGQIAKDLPQKVARLDWRTGLTFPAASWRRPSGGQWPWRREVPVKH